MVLIDRTLIIPVKRFVLSGHIFTNVISHCIDTILLSFKIEGILSEYLPTLVTLFSIFILDYETLMLTITKFQQHVGMRAISLKNCEYGMDVKCRLLILQYRDF